MRPSSYDFVLPYNFDNSAQQLKDEHNMEYSAYFLNKDDHEIVRLIRGKLDLIKHVTTLIYENFEKLKDIKIDDYIETLKPRFKKIGKTEKAKGNKPETLIDIKEVTFMKIINPWTLKTVTEDHNEINVLQNNEIVEVKRTKNLKD